nr:uncharacterized protein LOC109162703 [Ipomoea batatas]GMC78460.1 uncharacterized protein LOC109162703 [Ipomoea batatas]
MKELEEVENVMEEIEPSTGNGEQMVEPSPKMSYSAALAGFTTTVGCQESHARTEPELKEQYGPWMLVAKAPRRGRFSNSKGTGFGKGDNFIGNHIMSITSPPKVNNINTNSRFAVLDNEEVEVEEVNVAVEEVNNVSSNNKSPLNSKGKRPGVLINEKQILNDHERRNISRDSTITNRASIQRAGETSRQRSQAAAQVEHTVVRGNNSNGVSTSTIVVYHENDEPSLGIREYIVEEHHSDPPDPLEDTMDEDPSPGVSRNPTCSSPEDAMEV